MYLWKSWAWRHENQSGCGHGRIRNSLIIKYQFCKSVETQPFFLLRFHAMFYNSFQINLLQTRSVAASRHRIRWRTKIWWRKSHVTEKTPGKTMWRKKPRRRWSLWRHGRPWPCEWVSGGSLTGWAKRTSRGFTSAGACESYRLWCISLCYITN